MMLATRSKRFLAMLLALIMCLSTLPVGVFAESPEELQERMQIVDAGGTVYYNTNGEKVENGTLGEDGVVVEMSKTVEATGTENLFDVTLQVKTNQKLTEIPASTPDAAVMLVLDVSNSMDDCVRCGKEQADEVHQGKTETKYYCSGESGRTYDEHWHSYFWSGRYDCKYCHKTLWEHNEVTTVSGGKCAYRSRLADAQAAALDFLNQFANETGATGDDRRMVAVVSFGSDAQRELDWVNIRTQEGMNAAISAINNVKVGHGHGFGSDYGGTNIEGGLMLAKNILNAGRQKENQIKDVDYLYTILLTDGNPTYHVEKNSNSTSFIGGTRGGGSETNKSDAKDVGKEASAIRSITNLSKLYSICFGTITSKNKETDVWETKPFGDWWDANPSTNRNMTVGEWLQKFSSAAYNGQATGLFDSFDSIAGQIAMAAQAWRVTDTMGSNILYQKALPVSNKAGNGTINNVVSMGDDGKSFVWDILSSELDDNITDVQLSPDGKMISGTLGYTFKYQILLNNVGFTETTTVPTNESAVLKYMVADEDGNWPTSPDDLKTGFFAVPQVKGLAGDLAFDKEDPAGNPVNGGVEFTLTCQECSPAHTVLATAVSGKVAFTETSGKGIPSGHTYTLRETKHDGYQELTDTYAVSVAYGEVTVTKNGTESVNISNMTIINKHDSENRDLTITKAWLPAAIEPSTGSVTVDLYCGDEPFRENIQISSSNNWAVTIAIPTVDEDTGLPLTDSYTVKETDHPSGSTPSSQAFKVNYDEESETYTCTVTNVRSGQEDIPVTKTWVGGENHPSVTLGLVAMGETTPAADLTVELSENNLSHTFPSVELYDDNGDPYNYRVMEKVTVEENGAMVTKWVSTGTYEIDGVNYAVSTSEYTVTNTIAQEKSVTVSGHNEWVDGTGDIRPDSVEVNLYADGKDTGLTATATGDTWTFDFGSSLPKYAIPGTQVGTLLTYGTTEGLTADGHEIEYTVKDSVAGYDMTSEGTAGNGYTVTNTRKDIAATDEVTITKVWEDDKNADDTRPDSVTLILQRSSNGTADDTFNSANHTYTFLQDTEVYEVTQIYTFENLSVYDAAGYKYQYTVKEQGEQDGLLDGKDGVKYAVRYEGTTAINSLNTGSATTSVTVHKNWVAPSTEGLSVTVYVMNGDQQAASKTLDGTETTPWTYTFTDLPMYGGDGKKINYTVKEDPVAGYTPSEPVLVNGVWNITNTIEQDDTMEVSVQKTWENGTATVPADLEVTLYADDIKVGSHNLTAEESWGYTFKNLPRYAIPGTTTINDTSVSLTLDGHAIRYTVEEEKAAGYTMTHSSRTESVNVSYQFTNSFDAGTTHIQVNKLWKDPGNSGTRPDSIWVGLFADGVYKDNMELTAANNWSGEFSYQPMYSDVNKTIAYTVREMADADDTVGVVSGENITLGYNTYTVTILSGTITNTMEGDVDGSQVVYSVNKVWNGPSSTAVSFGLYESNTAADPIQTISGQDMVALLNAENVWVGTFAAVPKYDDNGQRINYVVKEIFTLEEDTFAVTSGIVSLDGITYTASSQQSGNTIIFTNTVNETNDASISGVKQWVLDGAPADVNAPASIQVELYADDVATGEIKTVDAEDNWAYEWTGLQRYNSETHMPIEYSVREVGAYGVTTLDAEGAIQQTLVKYGDNYFTVTYENGNIINTYLTRDEYKYRVDRIYNYYVDGVLQSTDTVKGDLISGSKGQVVTDLNTDSYKNTDNKSEYTYISGGPTFTDGDTVKVGVTLTEPGEYVITLTYEYRYTTPTDPGTGGGGGGGWTPPTPDPDPDEEIPDEETPLNPNPDDEVIDIDEGETPLDDGTEIIDPETPLGNLPQTGAAEAVNPFATAGFMALAASMAAAGLVLTRTKSGKREED